MPITDRQLKQAQKHTNTPYPYAVQTPNQCAPCAGGKGFADLSPPPSAKPGPTNVHGAKTKAGSACGVLAHNHADDPQVLRWHSIQVAALAIGATEGAAEKLSEVNRVQLLLHTYEQEQYCHYGHRASI